MRPLLWFELGALIICAVRFKELKKDKILKWFLLLLIVTNIVEWGSYFGFFTIFRSNPDKKSSNWIYNIFDPLEFGFFCYYYYCLIGSEKIKKRIIGLYALLLMLACINVSFIQGWRYLDSYTYILGCVLLIYLVVSYFKQLAQNMDENNILVMPHFWISVGILLFYSGDFFLFSFFEYFLQTHNFHAFLPAWKFFSNFLNIILYTCLSIAFLCSQKPQNISSSASSAE